MSTIKMTPMGEVTFIENGRVVTVFNADNADIFLMYAVEFAGICLNF